MNHRLQKPTPDALKKATAEPAPKLGLINGTVMWESNVGQVLAGVSPAAAMDIIVTPSVGKVELGTDERWNEEYGEPGVLIEPVGGYLNYRVTDLPLNEGLNIRVDIDLSKWSIETETAYFVTDGNARSADLVIPIEDVHQPPVPETVMFYLVGSNI